MKNLSSPRLRTIVGAIALIGLTACSGSSESTDDGSGGGLIIGTGKTVEGTTTSNKLFASNDIQVRSASGEKSTVTFDQQGRFKFDKVTGSGPWLLRSDLGNSNYLYGFANDSSADALIQNVHSYSDAVVRSWYATQNLDVNTVFEAAGASASMPTVAQATAIYDSLIAVVADVIDNYAIGGVNLNTVEFAANGSGIDSFILQNPVIHNDGSITITIFDPANKTASVAVEDFNLKTDLTRADTEAPSAPSNLRALPSASDEITLVWNVASDNIGITRYAISRNGQQVATSPYPVFVDGGLTSGLDYNYSIVAIDSAGNASASSIIATATPQSSTMDNIAPPTPSSVLIDTRRGSLDLTWTQTGIGDVASYAISRGTTPTNLSSYLNVNSTFFFDDAVNAGVEYCYRISAVDASGNASVETGLACATAPGTTVTGGSTTPTPPVTTPGDGLTAPLVDVSNLACTTELPFSVVTTEMTLTEGCYIAQRGFDVNEPGSLTIEPGTVIKFGANDSVSIGIGGSIIAKGTAAKPIVFTGIETTPGHWRGVTFRSSSAKNVLDYVQIEYAGNTSNTDAALEIANTLTTGARAAISNSTFRFNAGAGMIMGEDMPLSTFDGNRYTGNAMPVYAHGASVYLLDKRSLYTGNTLDAILIDSTDIEIDTTWPALAVPYHIESRLVVSADTVFSVEPGTNIKFEDDVELLMQSESTLMFEGTAENPISLSGVNPVQGGWNGINLFFTDKVSQLRHVTVQHAGGDDTTAAIRTRSANSNRTKLALENVTISDSFGFGIATESFTEFTEFTNVTITGNDGIADIDVYAAQIFNNAGNYTGNVVDAIVVQDLRIDQGDIVLSNTDVPYHVGGLRVADGMLTLEPGVELMMAEDSAIDVSRNGEFISNGTADAPVSIVGQQPVAGFWEGMEFALSNSLLNRLTHTLVSDGGGELSDDAANVRLDCRNPARLMIENSRIENSAGYGLYIPADNCFIEIDAGTTFTNNALGDRN